MTHERHPPHSPTPLSTHHPSANQNQPTNQLDSVKSLKNTEGLILLPKQGLTILSLVILDLPDNLTVAHDL